MSTAAPTSLTPPRAPLQDRVFNAVVWGGLALALLASFLPAEIFNLPRLFTGGENMADYAAGFGAIADPSNAAWRRVPRYFTDMGLTVAIALWGTVFSVLLGAPLSLLCANNVAPPYVVRPFRFIADVARSINEFVYAILFTVAVGLGPFAGVMAVTFGTMGVIAKLYSEAVETIDPKPVEGVRAAGATRLQEIIFGVLPQVAPLWTSLALYRFESNVRAATVLGIVGAGGIGQTLLEAMRGFKYDETAVIILVIIAVVFITDFLSGAIRKRMV